jgi:hypothetical protein
MPDRFSPRPFPSLTRSAFCAGAVVCGAFVGLVALATLPTTTGYAEQSDAYADSPARLNAQRYQPMDSGQPIHILLYEDGEQALALAAALKAALERAGHLVTDEGAPLTLSFELTDQGQGGSNSNSSILTIDSSSGGSIDQRYQAHLDVFSSTQQSLTTGAGQPYVPQGTTGARIRYQIYLNDQASGQRLWEGWATAPLLPQGAEATALAMTEPLVAALGETIRDRGITLGRR